MFLHYFHLNNLRYYDSYCRISRLREHIKKNSKLICPLKVDPLRRLRMKVFSQHKKKCLECSETKEYATIFCDIFLRVSVKK